MGGSSISSSSMKSYYEERSSTWGKATNCQQVFKETSMLPEFDPSVMKLPREACDSAESPRSRGIIYAEDVTGSMGSFIMSLITQEFPRLIRLTYDAVSYNPHICFMGVGDAVCDIAPLQVTQFETDLRMLDQLQKIYIEEGGGGNDYESYILPWYFAGKYVKMDCWEKRREKGFLFTFGDEEPTPSLSRRDIEKVFGSKDYMQEPFITAEDCLKMASEKFNCYHIILHGSHYNWYSKTVIRKWNDLMGSHAIDLSDHQYLPELVTTILNMYEGHSKTESIEKIQGETAKRVVKKALEDHEEWVEKDEDASSDNADSKIELF